MYPTRKLPIGIESFEKLRTEDFYYVDKTGLIKELLGNWGEVNLFTRPRRFGKSLNMSMFKHFFEIGQDASLFHGLKIAGEKELCDKYMGKFPVISISLKGVSGATYQVARSMMCSIIAQEAMRFGFLQTSDKLSAKDKLTYDQLTTVALNSSESFAMSDSTLTNSLLQLSKLLHRHFDQKVIILIDEYDVPLDKAYRFGYYDQMVDLIHNLFSQALKTNESLFLSILTGCLRVSKESIFTGLNNVKVHTITDVAFDEFFGFTDKEVCDMLTYYGLSHKYVTAKEWYDGYQFGNMDVYCPWDVLNYCSDLCADPEAEPRTYWSNTSSNDIVKKFIYKAKTATVKKEIESLIAGEAIPKTVLQELTYSELEASIQNLWSVLFTTGYLTKRGKSQGDILSLVIPNQEIHKIFKTQIYEWFRETAANDTAKLDALCQAFADGNAPLAEQHFNSYLKKTISIRDTNVPKAKKENFYHGILLGLLSHREDWAVSSNAESGDVYSDILVEIEEHSIGIVIEVKYAENDNLEAGCKEALRQIEKNRYEELLIENGMTTILKFGIACYKKHCKIVMP